VLSEENRVSVGPKKSLLKFVMLQEIPLNNTVQKNLLDQRLTLVLVVPIYIYSQFNALLKLWLLLNF
jgi:hypothetical protein